MTKKTREKNPERILARLHSLEGTLAGQITHLAGSMKFVYFHILWFSLWLLVNHGFFAPSILPFDPYPYGLLTMIVSLEAIFLSAFIMVAQNRQALLDEYRDLEENIEDKEAEEEVEDIQQDLDDLKRSVTIIQKKILSGADGQTKSK